MTKKTFSVNEGETIEACLQRMKDEGYTPVRRIEKPVFVEKDGKTAVSHQEIIFEGKKL